MTANPLDKLHDLAGFLESQSSLEDNLGKLVTLAADTLDAAHCSIMLYIEGEGEALRLRVCATHGALPEAAFAQTVGRGEGIAGHVAASGVALLVEDIGQSVFASCARRPGVGTHSLMSAPISVNRKLIGVINLSEPNSGTPFTQADLALLEIVAFFVGKSIQVVQLQNLLNSRFAQIALAQDAEKAIGGVMLSTAYDTDKMAKIVAKSFFREMTQAGFGSSQIIQAASEIISQLSSSLHKHSKRLDKS
ncbi:MAG TPA: GAF domain-containing protein [Sulfuriferula sp.]|nr:GAF domain-containing protein [Sulfuriferula sp.]